MPKNIVVPKIISLVDHPVESDFVKFPRSLYTNPKYTALSSDSRIMWLKIFDRLLVSIHSIVHNKRREFIDHDLKAPFCWVTNQTLATCAHCSISTVTKCTDELVTAGLIVKKKTRAGGNKYFVAVPEEAKTPAVTPIPDSTNCKPQNLGTSDTELSKTESLTVNAVNTPDGGQAKQHGLEALKSTLTTKLGLPLNAINILADYSFGDPERLNLYANALTVGKYNTNAILTAERIDLQVKFEDQFVQETLFSAVTRIIPYAERATNENLDNLQAYLRASFANYFREVADARLIVEHPEHGRWDILNERVEHIGRLFNLNQEDIDRCIVDEEVFI